MATAPVIALSGVDYFYGAGALRKQILFDLELTVQPGEILILTGPSGSGKTTLLTLIGGLRAPQNGHVRVLGRELRDSSEAARVSVRRAIGYVFQSHNLLRSLSALRNVQLSLHGQGLSRRDAAARASQSLVEVGLGVRAKDYPEQLSGGERQRVAIARALARQPHIILADEPTASLDRQVGRQVVDLMSVLARRHGCAVLLVTHDNRILDVADRILHIEDGRLSA